MDLGVLEVGLGIETKFGLAEVGGGCGVVDWDVVRGGDKAGEVKELWHGNGTIITSTSACFGHTADQGASLFMSLSGQVSGVCFYRLSKRRTADEHNAPDILIGVGFTRSSDNRVNGELHTTIRLSFITMQEFCPRLHPVLHNLNLDEITIKMGNLNVDYPS
ncbi:hypothetical protein RHSIM_Rhsim04G0105600 [Rhododendron simsii]|uniref:Uncharacterized protein n=1 Tax=Rhododendron simsii TaxID=118357 RepID=A0A834H3C2_RHOSS|nr:hypothetical protein RHSIM_Rhsim04G0105600 [Rhododendron simsii]